MRKIKIRPNVKKELNSLNKRSESIIRNIIKGFLSEGEIEKVLTGEEFWLIEDEIKERLKNWIPYRERNEL